MCERGTFRRARHFYTKQKIKGGGGEGAAEVSYLSPEEFLIWVDSIKSKELSSNFKIRKGNAVF